MVIHLIDVTIFQSGPKCWKAIANPWSKPQSKYSNTSWMYCFHVILSVKQPLVAVGKLLSVGQRSFHAVEGHLNLYPRAWGQLRLYGLLDPARWTWCEVIWSDASLAACLLSKETVRSRIAPRWCCTAVVKSLYWIVSEKGALLRVLVIAASRNVSVCFF